MTVHVWAREGEYLGYLWTQFPDRLDFVGNEEEEEKVKAALMSVVREADSDFIEIRVVGRWQRTIEFPGPDWLAIAAIMTLPAKGYRVHVIMEAAQTADN
jgi:hypothetical protein